MTNENSPVSLSVIGTKANTKGIHIRSAGKTTAHGTQFSVYEIWNGDIFVCSAYGGCSLMMLGMMAERLTDTSKKRFGPGTGLDYLI